jgi:hypothetical protein
MFGLHSKQRAFAIVSGGQTGADRAALDAALAAGVPCGGWCPPLRKAEDGVIALRYPLRCMDSGGYAGRTRQNVCDSDGTLIVTFDEPRGGTALTVKMCRAAGVPMLIVDGAMLTSADAARAATEFVREHDIRCLNVAGPRASREPRSYPFTLALVSVILAGVAHRAV